MGLPWVRLDSHIASHDKILRLLADPSAKKWQAAFSYTCALGWSGDQGTDGYVPILALPFIHGTTTTGRMLVKYDLWDEVRNGSGWQIRNYADRQQTNAVATAKREMKRISGEKGNCARWHGKDCWTTGGGVPVSSDEGTKCCVYGCFRILPLSHFGPSPKSPDGLNSRCKPCVSDAAMVRKHGLTAAQKEAIAEAQGGCLTCRNPNPGMKGWVVDHDRSCCPGEASCVRCRRGILCQFCNSALGYARDNPTTLRALADYLESDSRLRVADAIPGRDSIRTDGRTNEQNEEPTHRNHQSNGSNARARVSKIDRLDSE